MSLLLRVQKYGLSSCLVNGEIKLLNFNFQAQSKMFDLIGQVATSIAKGVADKGAMDSFAETKKKLLVAVETYHAKRKETKKIELKLQAIESKYLKYDKDLAEFEKYYDKTFID